ncbi:MAG: hypothetical protein AAGA03_06105 [Planctomycetota bacterium]
MATRRIFPQLMIQARLTGLFVCLTLASTTTWGQNPRRTLLYRGADALVQSTRDLEKLIDRSPTAGRELERCSDRLQSAAVKLRTAARRPERVDTLLRRWTELNDLLAHVSLGLEEVDVLGETRLYRAWRYVLSDYSVTAQAISGGPTGVGGVCEPTGLLGIGLPLTATCGSTGGRLSLTRR